MDVVLDWYPNALHAFLYVAIDKGYFADEGLKVNIRFPSNANDALSLVAAGKAEVGLYYQQDVILARANQDVPVQVHRRGGSGAAEHRAVPEGEEHHLPC